MIRKRKKDVPAGEIARIAEDADRNRSDLPTLVGQGYTGTKQVSAPQGGADTCCHVQERRDVLESQRIIKFHKIRQCVLIGNAHRLSG